MANNNKIVIQNVEQSVSPVVQLQPIEHCILTVRNVQVIVDSDLADLYGVSTGRLNEAVKRNIERFPEHFRFQLTKDEMQEVIANCEHLKKLKFSPVEHFVFTEQGVSMLSALLRSKEAVQTSIRIMDAFVAMHQYLRQNAQILVRLDQMEAIQNKQGVQLRQTVEKVDVLFEKMEDKTLPPKEGVFFDGQIFDAYVLASDMVKRATKQIVLIDNYVDETVLALLDKRGGGVSATIYTGNLSKQLKLDVAKHNAQYAPIDVKVFSKSHDRFLIIDDEIYHLGASLKDLGKKWFAFSKISEMTADELINRIN